MKKFLVVLLAMIMILSASACELNSDGDKENPSAEVTAEPTAEPTEEPTAEPLTLVGEWECEIDMAEYFEQYMEVGLPEVANYLKFRNLDIVILLEFEDDGDYKMKYDKDSAEEVFEKITEQMLDGMIEYYEDMIKAEGMTVEEFAVQNGFESEDAMWEELEISISEEMDINEMFPMMWGEYILEGDKLYMDEDAEEAKEKEKYDKIELEKDSFKIIESVGVDIDNEEEEIVADILSEALFPLEFERV